MAMGSFEIGAILVVQLILSLSEQCFLADFPVVFGWKQHVMPRVKSRVLSRSRIARERTLEIGVLFEMKFRA